MNINEMNTYRFRNIFPNFKNITNIYFITKTFGILPPFFGEIFPFQMRKILKKFFLNDKVCIRRTTIKNVINPVNNNNFLHIF